MENRFNQGYERTLKSVHSNVFLKNVWKLGSNKVMRNGEDRLFKRAFEKSEKISFKQCYERTAKSVHTKGPSRKVWKLGSNNIMRERRSPFIQTCF